MQPSKTIEQKGHVMKNLPLYTLVLAFGVLTTLPAVADEKAERDADCVRLCGQGYYYDRPGAKNNGQELVCTKYPLPCGYGCTVGWKFRYLVNGTNYTCQEAIQQ